MLALAMLHLYVLMSLTRIMEIFLVDRQPPNIFARLEMPLECHLSDPGHFAFVIEYSTDSKTPITIDNSRRPLSVFEGELKTVDQLIECRDTETGEEVLWSGFFGCWDSDPHPAFPDNKDFVEVLPDKP
jgi:hypothetical protein